MRAGCLLSSIGGGNMGFIYLEMGMERGAGAIEPAWEFCES